MLAPLLLPALLVASDAPYAPAPLPAPGGAADGHTGGLGFGPLRLSSQSPGQSLRLGLVPHTPQDLAEGEWKLYAGASWVNIWSRDVAYELDYESLTSEALVAYGMGSRWNLEVGLTTRTTFGGHLDGFTQGFHKAFGIDQNGRDEVPRDRTLIRIDANEHQDGVYMDDELQGAHVTFVRSALIYELCQGDGAWPSVSLGCTMQVPLGSRGGYEGEILDVALDLSVAKGLGDWVGYVSAACTRFGSTEVHGIELHRFNWAGLAAIEYRLTSDWSLVVQYLLSQGIAPDLYVFSKASHEIALGTQMRFGRQFTVQLGVIENVVIHDNSPDFGVHLAFELRL